MQQRAGDASKQAGSQPDKEVKLEQVKPEAGELAQQLLAACGADPDKIVALVSGALSRSDTMTCNPPDGESKQRAKGKEVPVASQPQSAAIEAQEETSSEPPGSDAEAEENRVRERKAAHARYMRFSRSLKSDWTKLGINNIFLELNRFNKPVQCPRV